MLDSDGVLTRLHTTPRRPILAVLRRGLGRRCPRCGEGKLFLRRIEFNKRCSECHLLFQRDHGDTLMFLVVTDRIPLLAGIAAAYFGFQISSVLGATAFLALLIVPMVMTFPHRQGLALALDYLSRVYLPDPSDEIHRGEYVFVTDVRKK